jgi:hypothetical protein
MKNEDATLSVRLDKLERQLNFWRALVVLSVLVCGASIATQLRAAPTRIDATAVVAHEFDLVNASGRVTARLASDPTNPDSPNLVLKYPNDKPAMLLGTDSKTGASISLLNSEGIPRVMLNESADGPAISLFDENDRIRIELDALKPGPQISVYDKARKRTVVAFSN